MRASRLVVALVLVAIGLVWLAQGTGLIGGGAMSGSAVWAVVGALLVLAAGAMLVLERRRSTSA